MTADKALGMGPANRVVEDGFSREAAEKPARKLITFPRNCLRHDRSSAHEQYAMDLPEAIVNEFHRGLKVIGSGEALSGAGRFAKGN